MICFQWDITYRNYVGCIWSKIKKERIRRIYDESIIDVINTFVLLSLPTCVCDLLPCESCMIHYPVKFHMSPKFGHLVSKNGEHNNDISTFLSNINWISSFTMPKCFLFFSQRFSSVVLRKNIRMLQLEHVCPKAYNFSRTIIYSNPKTEDKCWSFCCILPWFTGIQERVHGCW